MRSMFSRIACGIVIGAASLLIAADQPPTAAPKGAPDLSTPKAGALAFVRAMEANNIEAFRAVTVGSEEDQKLFEPLLGMVGAAKQLERAAREKFGKEGRFVVRNSPAVELEVHVQESDVTINGQTAILRHKGEENADPLTLKKTEAGWKVDLTVIQNRQQMSAAAGGLALMKQVLDQSAADIRAGKFRTAQEAEQAVISRMQQAAAAAPQPQPKAGS